MKKVLSIIGKILSIVLTVVLVLVLISTIYQRIKGQSPSIFGYHFMTVLTGSMEPEIHVDDAIIVKEVDFQSLKEGDVVTYIAASGAVAGQAVTHKIITAPYQLGDNWYIVTKGTANSEDDGLISESQLVGKVVVVSTFIGKIFSFFHSTPGFICVILMLVAILGYEIVVLAKASASKDIEQDEEVKDAIIQEYLAKNTEQNNEQTDKQEE